MIKKTIKELLNKSGYKLIPISAEQSLIKDLLDDNQFIKIYDFCKPYTASSIERMYSLYNSLVYIIENKISGDFVECGVWKGGSSMMIAKYLAINNIQNRKIYLYDTYEGMTKPTEKDIDLNGNFASDEFSKFSTSENSSNWCYSSFEEVKQNMNKTGFAEENIILIKGKVEDTIPKNLPQNNISLLRLDTDWYESTKHELLYLFPVLVENGVLIIDDFGHWKGAKKAVLEYFQENKVRMLLNRIDNTGRIGIKISTKIE